MTRKREPNSARAGGSVARQYRDAAAGDDFARRALALGLLQTSRDDPAKAERRLALLVAWERAGLSLEAIADAVQAGDLTLEFLDTPALTGPSRLSITYKQLAADRQVSLSLLQSLHLALGFVPPAASDQVAEHDLVFVDLLRSLAALGAPAEACVRLIRVYAHSLRTIAKAEVDLYESEVEARLRQSGLTERDLLERGSELGIQVSAPLETALLALYRRHKQHAWVEHSIQHAEAALEARGAYRRVERPPCICFVDLSGFTRLTEERGDTEAARMASSLAALIEDVSREHTGQPIRWLGDGGMFLFSEPIQAVIAALTIAERAPAVGLPATHIGIHCGPVIFQDGDVYGRTVNVAARIAGRAKAGEVLVSDEVARTARDGSLAFEAVGAAHFKGLTEPIPLHRASRARHEGGV